MKKRSYQEKFQNIKSWAEIVDYYWHLYEGDMYNHEDMWEHTLHSMINDDWWDWVDCEPAIKIEYEEHFRKYPRLGTDTQDIKRRLMLGKAITKKNGKSKNFTAFRCLMAIHDLMNDIQGTPTKQYVKQEQPVTESESPFERMFEID